MYTLSQIRNRVNTLKRKYATELKILRLFPLAEEFSLDWACQVADRQPVPETLPFIQQIAGRGFRFDTFMSLHRYLERCRDSGKIPDALGIIASLFPEIPRDRLQKMLPTEAEVNRIQDAAMWTSDNRRKMVYAAALVLASLRKQADRRSLRAPWSPSSPWSASGPWYLRLLKPLPQRLDPSHVHSGTPARHAPKTRPNRQLQM